MMKKRLIYLAHPYGGDQWNKNEAEFLSRRVQLERPDITVVSPIHGLHTGIKYETYPEDLAMENCLNLLSRCDECWAPPNWINSAGCCIEFNYCQEHNIPFKVITQKIVGWKYDG